MVNEMKDACMSSPQWLPCFRLSRYHLPFVDLPTWNFLNEIATDDLFHMSNCDHFEADNHRKGDGSSLVSHPSISLAADERLFRLCSGLHSNSEPLQHFSSDLPDKRVYRNESALG